MIFLELGFRAQLRLKETSNGSNRALKDHRLHLMLDCIVKDGISPKTKTPKDNIF